MLMVSAGDATVVSSSEVAASELAASSFVALSLANC